MNWYEKSDGELVAAFTSAGAQEAFEELVRRHAAMVFRTCRRVTGSHQDAEDATQTVFATLVLKGSGLTSYASLAGWLYSTAWHVSRRYRRAELTRRQRETRAQPVMPVEAGEIAGDDDSVKELYRALEMLPPDYRDALVLHHLQELTVGEVAMVLGCSVGTVASRLSRGRAMMRERLNGRGLVMADAMVATIITTEVARGAATESVAQRVARAAASALGAVASEAVVSASAAAAGGAAGVGNASGSSTGGSAVGAYAGLRLSQWAAVACVSLSLSAAAATAVATSSSERVRKRVSGFYEETRVSRSAGAAEVPASSRRVGSSSAVAVPEPASVSLLAAGGLLMRRNRRDRPNG